MKEITRDNPLLKIKALGQSVWMDFIRRGMILSGELRKLIEEDGLGGVTSNPSIFEKAIAGSHDYDEAIRAQALEDKTADEIYQVLTVEDVRRAADAFRPIYDRTSGADGFVSLEVSPHLARDTAGTIEEGRRLWTAVDRPNAMIKIPATKEGLPAIRQLVAEGINVNVTLLFGLPRYREVADAYLAGLEEREKLGKPLAHIASVASFFLSRIDVLLDPMLEALAGKGGPHARLAAGLRGEVAIASAKVAYRIYKESRAGERFCGLAARGARPQRLLWASTSTKNPAYRDVKYVEALIGPETVNTIPLETIHAYRDHGQPAPRLEEDPERADHVLENLAKLGIDLDAATDQLEKEAEQKFIVPFDLLLKTLEEKRAAALKEPLDRQSFSLGDLEPAVRERLDALDRAQLPARLWRKDPSLWNDDPRNQAVIANGLGWLHLAEKMEESLDDLVRFRAELQDEGFRQVVHMGMGGSSLAPLVFQRTFGETDDGLALTILDTTDPATILRIEREIPLAETLFIVATKSGTTTEPLAFGEYFFSRVKSLKGDRAGENFAAITDPGTPLAALARERHFRRVFLNFPDVGGRYSALSYFGLVPAALKGVDVSEIVLRALRMTHACASCVPAAGNPGVALGAVLGELALRGRDKVTFLMPAHIAKLGTWLEQLLAESTGKQGKGLLPVAEEPPGDPGAYGPDRLFVYIRLKEEVEKNLERTVQALREAGQPVVTITLDDALDLGQEFLRWEIATATIGAILGINPFDQPNVQEAKDSTNRLLEEVRKEGRLAEPLPVLREGPLLLYGPAQAKSASELLGGFLAGARPGDYLALLAYLQETAATELALQAVRARLRDRLGVATTLGYGPRYLHSTGQFHKGGTASGLFLLITADDLHDVPIPGAPYTFGTLKRAQALGDLDALLKHGLRAVRVHLGSDVERGLAALRIELENARGINR